MLDTIASGGAKTLQELAAENAVHPGTAFIYNGDFLWQRLRIFQQKACVDIDREIGRAVEGKEVSLRILKRGLVNQAASARMSGSTNVFAFAYITKVTADTVRAIPYAIGDLISGQSPMSLPFV